MLLTLLELLGLHKLTLFNRTVVLCGFLAISVSSLLREDDLALTDKTLAAPLGKLLDATFLPFIWTLLLLFSLGKNLLRLLVFTRLPRAR